MIRIGIDFACNDPDNGIFAGRVLMIELPDQLLELEARDLKGPRLVELGSGRIRVAGKIWQTVGRKVWIGNWCWDRFWFEENTAIDFLAWLHGRRLFNVTCGEGRLFNDWRREESLDREFAGRLLVKARLAEMRAPPTPTPHTATAPRTPGNAHGG